MIPSASAYYPLDRTSSRRDLATGAFVTVALLAGALWYGQHSRRAYVPPAAPAHDRALAPVPPVIDLTPPEDSDTTPAPAPAPSTQAATQADVPPLAPINPFTLVPEVTRPNVLIDPRAAIVSPGNGLRPGEGVYDPNALDVVPSATYQPAPNYPYALKRAGISGVVLVDFIVEPSGATSHVVAVSDNPDFAASAVEAVGRWRFHPGRRTGRAVRTHMQVPVNFRLQTEE